MGALILLGNHIGDINDLTINQLEALKRGSLFFAEDTRKFNDLLKRLKITAKKVYSFHDYSKDGQLDFVINKIKEGENVYYISDAGSPVISDPAYKIINAALNNNIEIKSISGISSVTAAIEVCGLPAIPFKFHGFLPRTGIARVFKNCGKGLHLFFESPRRILNTLADLAKVLPDVKVALLKDLTKTYQNIYRFVASDYKNANIIDKGEMILTFFNDQEIKSEFEQAATTFISSGSYKDLSKLLATILKENSKTIYNKIIKK